MKFEDIEIELSNDLFAYVSGEYEPYYEDNSFDYEYGSIKGIHDPGSGWAATDIEINKVELWSEGEEVQEDYDEKKLEANLEAHLNKELEEYEP